MDSLENNNNILKQTGEPGEQTHDVIRGKTEFEMPWVSPLVLSAASHSAVPEPQADSTFSPPPSASRCLPNTWSDVPGYPRNLVASDQDFTQSDSGVNNVAFTSPNNLNSAQSGYLLPCNTTDQVGSVNYWRPEIVTSTSSMNVRQLSSSYSFAASRQFEGNIGGELISSGFNHAQPGQPSTPSFQYHGVDSASSSSWDSSTISLSSPGPTLISSPVHELPTFMSPVETAKPCPQYCQCHGYTSISLANNHGNVMIYPMPDLLHNTKPDQFSTSSTTSTMCMTSPLVCPGPFQPSPPTSFKPFRPGFADDEGRNSPSSTSSLSLVSSAPIASERQAAPHGRQLELEGAYPVQVVPSAWLTSLVHQDQGNVGKAIENEQIKPTTVSMITNPTLQTEHSHVSVPPLFAQTTAQNYDKPDGEDLPLEATNSASIYHATADYCSPSDYHQSYHHPYPARFPTEFPLRPPSQYPCYPPPEYPAYPPPEYPGRCTIEYHAQPTTPAYEPHPTYPPSCNPGSQLLSRLTSRSFSPFDDWRVGVQHRPDPRGFPSHGYSGQPQLHTAASEPEKQPRRQRPPNRSGKRLVDQFPDLLPVIAWCLNYPQTNTSSSSSSKPNLSTTQIREIVIECVPGIKERGGIGISTIMKLVQELKKKLRNKVYADQATMIPMTSPAPSSVSLSSTMPLSSQENYADRPKLPADSVSSFPVMKENSAEHPKAAADLISSSTTNEDDIELPRAPTESILCSLMKLADDIANAEKPSRLRLTASLKTSKSASMTTVRNNISHQRALENEAQQKTATNTATTIGYDNDTGATIFRSLLEAHDITVDDVKRMKTLDTFYSPPSACGINGSEAKSLIKSSDIQPEIAAPDEGIQVATDSAKCNDQDLDDDHIMVIDTASRNI